MAKYKVEIRRVERYSTSVVVEAGSPDAACAMVERKWNEDDELYELVTDVFDESSTDITTIGLATEDDVNNYTNI